MSIAAPARHCNANVSGPITKKPATFWRSVLQSLSRFISRFHPFIARGDRWHSNHSNPITIITLASSKKNKNPLFAIYLGKRWEGFDHEYCPTFISFSSAYCYYNFVLFPWLDWTLLLMTWLTLLLYYQFDTYTNKSSCSSIKTKNISFANYTSTSF